MAGVVSGKRTTADRNRRSRESLSIDDVTTIVPDSSGYRLSLAMILVTDDQCENVEHEKRREGGQPMYSIDTTDQKR